MADGLHDLGSTYEESEIGPSSLMTEQDRAKEKHYPMLHELTSTILPGLDRYEAGEEIMLVFKGVITSKSVDEREVDGEVKKQERVTIELREGACQHRGAKKLAEEMGVSEANAKRAMASDEGYGA